MKVWVATKERMWKDHDRVELEVFASKVDAKNQIRAWMSEIIEDAKCVGDLCDDDYLAFRRDIKAFELDSLEGAFDLRFALEAKTVRRIKR